MPKGQSDADLRVWATKVLKEYSEIPLPAKVVADLNSGKITLFGEANDTVRAEGSLEGKVQARNADVTMSNPSPFHFWMDWGVQAVVGVGTLLVAGAAIFADARIEELLPHSWQPARAAH